MKLKEIKHNHSLTDLLKILIFAILMLAPISAVATRCMYVVCNKNAYQSYSNKQEAITSVVQPGEKVIEGMTYTFVYTGGTYTNNFEYKVLDGKSNLVEKFYPSATWTLQSFIPYYSNGHTDLITYDTNNTRRDLYDWELISNDFYFVNKQEITMPDWSKYYNLVYSTYTDAQLDNVFEYSVNELENSQLFNWTENTAIYTGVKAMTTQLEITGNVIPILITYWFLLTVIYVIIDIILKLFTVLTHMIGSKQA